MSARFNKPPSWPRPPAGWEPAPDWVPDPTWPAPPPGWQLWVTDTGPQWPSSTPTAPIAVRATTPAPPAQPSLTSTLLDIGSPVYAPTRASRSAPSPARMIGWGALGLVLLVVAGFTVDGLATPSTQLDSAESTPGTATDGQATGRTTTGPTGMGKPSAGPAGTGQTDQPGAIQDGAALHGTTQDAAAIEQAIARAENGTALAELGELKIHARGSSDGYARARFGSARTDTDGNGCDQRNDVLRRDLTGQTLKAGTNGCTVMTGTLSDPYTGRTIAYRRAGSGPARVRIDHVVPLGDAWMKGAQTWSVGERAEFATDPLNLLAVGASVTAGKRGSDAVRWLPPAIDYRCDYVARQVAVKRKYQIWITTTERQTIGRILTGCASLRLPQAGVIALGGSPLADPGSGQPVTVAKGEPGSRRPGG